MSQPRSAFPPVATLKLARAPWDVLVAHGLAFALFLLILGGSALAGGISLLDGTGSEPAWGMFLLALVAVGSPTLIWLAAREVAGGRLVVAVDRVEVSHPGIFRKSLVVPLSALRVVSVDAARTDARFPLYSQIPAEGAPAYPSGVLWRKAVAGVAASPLPYLGIRPGTPNVALVFEQPIAAPKLKRAERHGPVRGEALAGLLLTVRDHEAARSAFAQIERTRHLDSEDWALLSRNLGLVAGGTVPAGLTRASALEHHDVNWARICVVLGLLIPPLALAGVVGGAAAVEKGMRRPGFVICAVGIAVIAVRTALVYPSAGEETSSWFWVGCLLLAGAVIFTAGAATRTIGARPSGPDPQSST